MVVPKAMLKICTRESALLPIESGEVIAENQKTGNGSVCHGDVAVVSGKHSGMARGVVRQP